MKKLCFINGSLQGKKSSSLKFINMLDRRLSGDKYDKRIITVKAKTPDGYRQEDLQCLAGADAIILVFPLFVYGLPAPLMRLLMDYDQYVKTGNEYNHKAKVYAVVNCGFFKPGINQEAVRVLKNYCHRFSLDWRFAVCIASGLLAAAMAEFPFMYLKLKKAFAAIAADMKNDHPVEKADYLINPILPKSVILAFKAHFEKKMDYKRQQKKQPYA